MNPNIALGPGAAPTVLVQAEVKGLQLLECGGIRGPVVFSGDAGVPTTAAQSILSPTVHRAQLPTFSLSGLF